MHSFSHGISMGLTLVGLFIHALCACAASWDAVHGGFAPSAGTLTWGIIGGVPISIGLAMDAHIKGRCWLWGAAGFLGITGIVALAFMPPVCRHCKRYRRVNARCDHCPPPMRRQTAYNTNLPPRESADAEA